MSKMKYSGVEWIGDIPEFWETKRLRYLLTEIKVGPFGSALSGDDIKTSGIYWVYNQRCVLDENFVTNDTFVDENKFNELKTFEVKKNDILLTTRGTIGKVAIVPNEFPKGIIHPCLIRFKINEKLINTKLLKLIFNCSDLIQKQLNYKSNSTTIEVIYSYNLKDIFLPIIPQQEQKLITNFLYEKTLVLDDILFDLNREIEILNNYKRGLITEKVTENNKYTIDVQNGKINLNFENKSKIVRIKNVLNGITDGTHGTFDRVYNGEYLLSAKNVFEVGLKIGENESMISYKDYKDIIKCGYPKKNDLLMCCVGTVGRTMVYKENKPFAFQRSVLFMRVDNNKILPEFLNYSMNSNYMLEQEKVLVNKSAQDGIYQGTVKNMYLYLPALNKQKEIVDYLDKKCEQIDKIIEEKQKQIQKIEEYKKSVIYEYVTGKKRVEGAEELYG